MRFIMSKEKFVPITVAYGDGIGPDIMSVTLDILNKAGARISPEVIEVGEKVYLKGYSSGISDDDWKTIIKNRVFLKAPITTPLGTGYKSLNVTIRKSLRQYANVRPCRSYYPFVNTHFPQLDVVIYRENEEDLYAGIEHRHSNNQIHCTKVISYEGSERIIRAAFEYAVKNNRKKVTCMAKENIMKISDGTFKNIFLKIGEEYPQIAKETMIIDIGAAKLAHKPNLFDVVVTLNLYGDIISDIVAEVSGSVGLAGSANIGDKYAMFEAIHGSAPAIAGQNKANPSGLINAAVMMLVHIGQGSVAAKVQNALLYTIESGVATSDIFKEGVSTKRVGTKEFGEAVVANLGKLPSTFKAVSYEDFEFDNNGGFVYDENVDVKRFAKQSKKLVGVDLYIDLATYGKPLADRLNKLVEGTKFYLQMISCRGLTIYPSAPAGDAANDHFRCRFKPKDGAEMNKFDINELMNIFAKDGLDVTKMDNLFEFDGQMGYSLGQSE